MSCPCRVLIADDVADIRRLVRMCLDPERFEIVGEASDGQEACDLAKQEKPDVIVLDLSMPVMDGLQAIPEIRRDSPDSKILVLSGFAADVMSSQAIDLGADGYMEKGGNFRELSSRLTDLCEHSHGAPGETN